MKKQGYSNMAIVRDTGRACITVRRDLHRNTGQRLLGRQAQQLAVTHRPWNNWMRSPRQRINFSADRLLPKAGGKKTSEGVSSASCYDNIVSRLS